MNTLIVIPVTFFSLVQKERIHFLGSQCRRVGDTLTLYYEPEMRSAVFMPYGAFLFCNLALSLTVGKKTDGLDTHTRSRASVWPLCAQNGCCIEQTRSPTSHFNFTIYLRVDQNRMTKMCCDANAASGRAASANTEHHSQVDKLLISDKRPELTSVDWIC